MKSQPIRTKRHHIPGGRLALESPYQVGWPTALTVENSRRVVDSLIQEVGPLFHRRSKSPLSPTATTIGASAGASTIDSTVSPPSSSSSSPPRLAEICFGLNQVTKGLERRKLSMIVLCKSVPTVMVRHLPTLCYLSETRVCLLTSLPSSPVGKALAAGFGMRSMVSIGFYKREPGARIPADVYEWLFSMAAPISLAERQIDLFQYLEPVLVTRAATRQRDPPEPAQKKAKRK